MIFSYLCYMSKGKEESILQKSCVRWFRLQFPNALIFAIPNGGSRHYLEAKNLKAEGVLSGVADLQILAPNKTLFIEMKTEKGRQNPNQKAFQNKITALGFKYFVCRSFDEFQNTITKEIQ